MAVAMAVVADLFHQAVLIDAAVAVVVVDPVDMHPKLAVNSLVLVVVEVEARLADLLPLLVAIIILPVESAMVLLPLPPRRSFLSQPWVHPHPHLHLHHLLYFPHPLHPFMLRLQVSLPLAYFLLWALVLVVLAAAVVVVAEAVAPLLLQ